MEIRAPGPKDLEGLLALIAALARFHGQEPAATRESLGADVLGESPWVHVRLTEVEGVLAGYVAVLPLARFQFGQRGIDIHHLYVAEPWRGRGIGGALVSEALRLGAALGASYCTVTATPDNRAAQSFYASLGFKDAPRFGARFWTPIQPPKA